MKNSNGVENFKIKLDDFKNKDKKKNLRGYFGEKSDEMLTEFDLYLVIGLILYMFCTKILLLS